MRYNDESATFVADEQSNGRGATPMQKFQHAWVSVDPSKREDIDKLEQMGSEGWELVSVIPWGQSIFLMFFKRPRE